MLWCGAAVTFMNLEWPTALCLLGGHQDRPQYIFCHIICHFDSKQLCSDLQSDGWGRKDKLISFYLITAECWIGGDAGGHMKALCESLIVFFNGDQLKQSFPRRPQTQNAQGHVQGNVMLPLQMQHSFQKTSSSHSHRWTRTLTALPPTQPPTTVALSPWPLPHYWLTMCVAEWSNVQYSPMFMHNWY